MVQLFAALGGPARRALFRQYAFGRYAAGVTFQSVIAEARAIGLSVRRTDALAILREVSGREISRSVMRYVPSIRVPEMKHYVPTSLRLEKRFQTIFEVRGTNLLTGEPEIRNVSFISDERLTMAEMKLELEETIRLSEGPSGIVDPKELIALEGLVRAEAPFT